MLADSIGDACLKCLNPVRFGRHVLQTDYVVASAKQVSPRYGPRGHVLFNVTLRVFVSWAVVFVVSIFATEFLLALRRLGFALRTTGYACFQSRRCMVSLLLLLAVVIVTVT